MLECRKAALRREFKKFLMDVVLADFTTENYETLQQELIDQEPAPEICIFCEYLELGDYFSNKLTEIDFSLSDLMLDLQARCEEQDRDATEEYYERQQEYRDMVLPKGGCMS